ncbi:MAG: hypoxanthine phosphoribosyltransferase [Solobacterium sp.]|nr:hypoxanthine phosphoribosyltransferase [Solobacterium sp.]
MNEIDEVLFTRDDIAKRVAELGAEITRDYEGKDLIVVGILKGAGVFMSDLIREINSPIRIDFMSVSSYGNSTVSSGIVRITNDLHQDIQGCSVLIVEDIIDTGNTLHYLREYLKNRGAEDVKICALLDKPSRRQVEVPVEYVGFEVEDRFIIGYGIDYAEKYRNLPFIGTLKQSAD